jgi:hypothetical protein
MAVAEAGEATLRYDPPMLLIVRMPSAVRSSDFSVYPRDSQPFTLFMVAMAQYSQCTFVRPWEFNMAGSKPAQFTDDPVE